jgi:hypothetical protein
LTEQFKINKIKKAFIRIIAPVFSFQKSVFMSRPFNKPFDPPKKECPNFILSEGTIEELIYADFIKPARHKNFKYNKERGARCCIGRVDGKIISFTFMTTLPYRDPVSAVSIVPEKGQVYQFEGEIRMVERGKAYGYHHSIHYFKKMMLEGHREAICLVEPSNTQSWQLHLRMGFEPKRVCSHGKIMGIPFVRWTNNYSVKD